MSSNFGLTREDQQNRKQLHTAIVELDGAEMNWSIRRVWLNIMYERLFKIHDYSAENTHPFGSVLKNDCEAQLDTNIVYDNLHDAIDSGLLTRMNMSVSEWMECPPYITEMFTMVNESLAEKDRKNMPPDDSE